MDVESISGANMYTIHQFLKDNKARVKKYTHLILHVTLGMDYEVNL